MISILFSFWSEMECSNSYKSGRKLKQLPLSKFTHIKYYPSFPMGYIYHHLDDLKTIYINTSSVISNLKSVSLSFQAEMEYIYLYKARRKSRQLPFIPYAINTYTSFSKGHTLSAYFS